MGKLLDAVSGAYLDRQLDYVKKKVFKVEYDDITYNQVFSVSTEAPAGAQIIRRNVMDESGKAKRMSSHAGDLPRVDVTQSYITNPVLLLADAFGWNSDEIDAAAMVTGVNLSTERASVARRKIEEEMNDITWYGDAETGIVGYLNNTDIGKSAAGAAWSTLTPAQLLADVVFMYNAVLAASRGKKKPNKLLLDPTEWSRLMTTPRSDTSDTTIAAWLVANTPFLTSLSDIMMIPELLDSAGDGTDVKAASVLDNRSTECEVDMPRDVTFHNPQEQGLEMVTPVSARFAGLSYMYPTGAYILTGV